MWIMGGKIYGRDAALWFNRRWLKAKASSLNTAATATTTAGGR
jgi:hypothetical protein